MEVIEENGRFLYLVTNNVSVFERALYKILVALRVSRIKKYKSA